MLSGTEIAPIDITDRKSLLSALLVNSDIPEVYPASISQQRLWFLDQLRGASTPYNVHVGLWLKGALDIAALRAALTAIVNRHDSFRTTFRFENGNLVQVIAAQSSAQLEIDEVNDVAEPIARAYEIAGKEVQLPFDLATGPLSRVRLIRVFPEDHVFLCTMHHIVTDSWSMQLFVKELEALYAAFSNAQPSPLPELLICYGDYAAWQRECFSGEALSSQTEYWNEKLYGAPSVLALPSDHPRPAEQSFCGSSETAVLADAVVSKLKKLAGDYHCTPFMVLLAAFKTLLYRYSGQPDVLVGVPVAGRNRLETESLIGFFVNTLVVRDNLDGNPRFTDVLAQVRETTLAGFANADVPFEKIVEVIQPERNLSYNPIFQVMFSSIKAAVQTHTFGNLIAYPYVVNTDTSIFDLSATLIEATDGQWCMQFEYNTDLFSHERIVRMLVDYSALLEAIVENPAVRLLQVPLGAAEPDRRMVQPGTKTKPRPDPGQVGTPTLSGQSAEYERNCKLLTDIWRAVLGQKNIGVRDNFFEIGGHSLLAARLIREIEKATGRSMRVSTIFRAPTISSFAQLLAEANTTTPDPIVVEICRGSSPHCLFTVAIPGVDTFGFGMLGQHMQSKHTVYKLQAGAPVILDRPFSAEELESLAQQYITAMKSVQAEGPYCLGAMCDGVRLAQAVIIALERDGAEVSLFTVFDTWVLENSMVRPLWALDYYRQRVQRFVGAPWQERWQIALRSLRRVFHNDEVERRSGWKKAYWPENFRPPRFQAPVLLFKRPRQPFYYVHDPEMGWGKRSSGGVEICDVACGHTELFREPYIRMIAEKISSRLSRTSAYGPVTVMSAPALAGAEIGTLQSAA